MTGRNHQDIIGGISAMLLGIGFLIQSFSYGIGTGTAMEAGYFPMMISILVIALGGMVTVHGFITSGRIDPISWRSLLAVLASVITFASTIGPLGLLPASALCVAVAAVGDPASRPVIVVATAAVVCTGVWVIFSLGLGLPIPIVRGVF